MALMIRQVLRQGPSQIFAQLSAAAASHVEGDDAAAGHDTESLFDEAYCSIRELSLAAESNNV